MFNHEPVGYRCPFCLVSSEVEGDFPYTKQDDIFYQDSTLVGIIASHWWPNNPGHVIIFPKQHVENIYSISKELLHAISDFSQYVALALKEKYHCDGVSTRQHNEPAGEQDVWHYHLHVFPRYPKDDLYDSTLFLSEPQERKKYSQLLKEYVHATPYRA